MPASLLENHPLSTQPQPGRYSKGLMWFRRDLRLTDNRMLEAATRDAVRVWPVFVADPDLLATHAAT